MAYNPDQQNDDEQNPWNTEVQPRTSTGQPGQNPFTQPKVQTVDGGTNPPAAPMNYEAARDAWMSGKYSRDEAGINQWNQEYNALTGYNGGDTGNLSNGGGMIDLLSNWAGGKGNGQSIGSTWTPAGGNGNNPNGQGVGAGGGPGGAGSGAGFGTDPGGKWDALYEQLMKRSKQGLELDPNDPIIRAQTDAYNAQGERARRNFLSSQAEKSSPYATGAQLGQERMSAENLGQNNAGFQAQLMGRELTSRREEIQNALSQMGGMLSDAQRLALQKELGYLNDATARYGIGTQAQTAADRLGFDIGNADINNYYRGQGL